MVARVVAGRVFDILTKKNTLNQSHKDFSDQFNDCARVFPNNLIKTISQDIGV